MTVLQQDVTITAADGYPLAATLFAPEAEDTRHVSILIGAAMGVERGFYAKFAAYLAEQGFHVLTLDYRGIGGSEPKSGRKRWRFDLLVRHWGERDFAAALDWLRTELKPETMLMVGNSVAGQILPLAANAHYLDGVLLVGSQSGHWKLWRGKGRLNVFLLWMVVGPALIWTWGHLPGWLMGGEPLPAGVFREWATWGRHPEYLVGRVADARQRYADFAVPTRLYSFSDDPFAPKHCVERLIEQYGDTPTDHRHYTPADAGLPGIGHFGFFRSRSADPFWREVVQWAEETAREKTGRQSA
jgi:predicted alpha/beta hydrolase